MTDLEELLRRPGLNPVNDSRKIVPGCVFCAIRGAAADGRKFIPEAVAKGAAVIVSDTDFPGLSVPLVRTDDSYRAWGLLCEAAAEFPAGKLRMHAVTGTNGKTTIAFLMKRLLGKTCGLISTIETDTGRGIEESARTTPAAEEFQRLLNEMRKNALTDCMMELSSHGLHQHRTGSAKFATAIFTNLTGDHLDYHHDMESYYQAKKLLFSELSEGARIVNVDDDWGKRLLSECGGIALSTVDPGADAFVSDIRADAGKTEFRLKFEGKELDLVSPLIGLHNVYNLAEAVTAALTAGVKVPEILSGLSEPFAVPGRLERIVLPNGAAAFVDYAHTDDALRRVLTALRPLCRGKLICVFGCGGDRDRTKRPRMGRAVAELADSAVVTSDNPRSEEPESIIREIEEGIPEGFPYRKEPDRAEAIRLGASLAGSPEDLLLVAGKGHERTQEIKGVKHPFDDREILRGLT